MSSRGGFKVTLDTPDALWSFDKKLLRKVMRQAGQEVSALAKAMIRSSGGGPGQPPRSRTGALARSIKVSVAKGGLGVKVTATAMAVRGHGPYGLFLEAGVQYQTSPVDRPKRVRRKRGTVIVPRKGQTTIMPHPFLSAALDRKGPGLLTRVRSAVQDGIEFKKQK